jgi:hypothetical protein
LVDAMGEAGLRSGFCLPFLRGVPAKSIWLVRHSCPADIEVGGFDRTVIRTAGTNLRPAGPPVNEQLVHTSKPYDAVY